jgi:hypothetical protein
MSFIVARLKVQPGFSRASAGLQLGFRGITRPCRFIIRSNHVGGVVVVEVLGPDAKFGIKRASLRRSGLPPLQGRATFA